MKIDRTDHLRIPGYVDAEECAELWKVHPETIKRYIKLGLLPATKQYGKWLIPEHIAIARELPRASWLAKPLPR